MFNGLVEERWNDVDSLFAPVVGEDEALRAAVAASGRAGMPQIQVAPNQGKLLHILARAMGARRILEIGTLAGYSTIWLARALPPQGRVVTLELEPRHASVARDNLRVAAVDAIVEVREGPALESLRALREERGEPFDLVFIDADKENTAEYFRQALSLTRDGGIIVVDNVVRHGDVLQRDSDDPRVQGMLRFNDELVATHEVTATVVQTVGVKGYDGLAIALVTRS